ncbi:MAG: hypothetical protein SGI86_20135 [Deltaproteobacteria bacterium]|nr:hypothetical protein [Deltaproteobacteria bacterium]
MSIGPIRIAGTVAIAVNDAISIGSSGVAGAAVFAANHKHQRITLARDAVPASLKSGSRGKTAANLIALLHLFGAGVGGGRRARLRQSKNTWRGAHGACVGARHWCGIDHSAIRLAGGTNGTAATDRGITACRGILVVARLGGVAVIAAGKDTEQKCGRTPRVR